MTFAEVRKFAVAALTAVAAIIPQVLGTLAGVIPENVASALTVVAVTAGAILVWLVPNAPQDPVAKVRSSVEKLGPLLEVIQDRVRREVNMRLPQTTADIYQPEARPDPPAPDPFVVPPAGR
ncbi:hypothetical protein [Rhodococcus aetherivorans]|uniref:hypothetical protein n=1 Tax=Rhodococcus aetherivorans TaxID=191292 RepID=UPI0002D230BA|nr:hypothetical protein [Rhodococcus aetherivorans]CCW14593.1 hypothetical protein EBESD8_51630 [Rhodococcus aetherivorans]